MSNLNGRDILIAAQLATAFHSGQKYGDESYYAGHLLQCANYHNYFMTTYEIQFDDYYYAGVGSHNEFECENEYLISVCIFLHDILEDTECDSKVIERCFGLRALEIVNAVSDGEGKTRKERKEACYKKLAGDRSATYVKLIDRIANTASGKKNDMYRKEHPRFKEVLYREDHGFDMLWNKIEENLFKYK